MQNLKIDLHRSTSFILTVIKLFCMKEWAEMAVYGMCKDYRGILQNRLTSVVIEEHKEHK